MLQVTFVLVSDNYASTTLVPLEIFHSAGVLWQQLHGLQAYPYFQVTVASLDGLPVVSNQGLSIAPHCAIKDVAHADLILLPTTGLELDGQLARHHALYSWLRQWHERGAYIASVCTGAAFLAEAGLLAGRRATTHWAVASQFASRWPNVSWNVDELITEDGRILCAGGVHSGMDLSLYLVEKFCGRDIALQCARALVIDMPRTHQSGYAVLPLSNPHSDVRIREVEDFIAEHYAENLCVERLADRARMSSRTFMRRFKAATGRLPGNYLQAQRIAIARVLLESSGDSVQRISYRVGYEDMAFFRKIFKRETGMTPGEYRSKFASGFASRADEDVAAT